MWLREKWWRLSGNPARARAPRCAVSTGLNPFRAGASKSAGTVWNRRS
eukprot:gene5469-6814_t